MSLMSRRTLLENTAKGGVALGAGTLLASCGSSSSSSSTASAASHTSSSAGTPKHGGTLHAGLTGGSSSDTTDPNTIVNNTDYARAANLYEGLVWLNADAQQYNRLAEEMTPNKDATVWTIRLRKGVEFHNGKTLTADDLIYSINRVINPKSPGEAANALSGIDAKGMKKLDNLTITVPFAKPYSTFPQSLANNITVYVVPTDFNPKKPIGTGPFKLASFNPGQQTILARNENYWNAPLPYLDQIVMTDYSDETSQVNALLGRAGRRDQPALPGRARHRHRVGQESRHLPRRRLEPVHDARRLAAVQRRACPAGVPARGRPSEDARDGVRRARHDRQ